MQLTAATRVIPHADAIFTELDDGQGVLLQLQTRSYFSLNRTGRRIWQLITEGATVQEICGRLADEHQTTSEKVDAAVADFIKGLLDANLVELTDAAI